MKRIFKQLNIPDSYGHSPKLPRYTEPEELVDVGPNIIGRMQRLTPATAQAWADMQAAAEDDSIELLNRFLPVAWRLVAAVRCFFAARSHTEIDGSA